MIKASVLADELQDVKLAKKSKIFFFFFFAKTNHPYVTKRNDI
jgi:hypothetical protein